MVEGSQNAFLIGRKNFSCTTGVCAIHQKEVENEAKDRRCATQHFRMDYIFHIGNCIIITRNEVPVTFKWHKTILFRAQVKWVDHMLNETWSID